MKALSGSSQTLNLQTSRSAETESTLPAEPTEALNGAESRAARGCVPPLLGWMDRARRGREAPAAAGIPPGTDSRPVPGRPGSRARLWAVRAGSCCRRGHHDYARLLQTMFHVSFRYIFGIPPLILVLLPVTSSDCHIKNKEGKEYENILMISINELDKMIGTGSNCLNNESNFFKRHICDDTKKAAFLNRAARKVKQFRKMNISAEFNTHLLRVSEGTRRLVNCSSSKEEKPMKEQKKNDPCFLKRLLQEIKTCWNKILRGDI